MVCATIVVESSSTKKRRSTPAEIILDRIGSALYEKCRLKGFAVSGFPDFAPLVAELSESPANESGTSAGDAFKVTSLHPSGNLIIQEQFFQQFGDKEETGQEFDQLVEDHNGKYNSDTLRLTERPSPKKPEEVITAEFIKPENGKELTPESVASLPNASVS